MHLKRSDHEHGPPIVPVTFHLEDPEGLTGSGQKEWQLMGGEGESLLELAMDHGINIEHACGGVCACSTCHIYVEQGMDQLTESTEAEDDRVEEAPAIQRNSTMIRWVAANSGRICTAWWCGANHSNRRCTVIAK